MQMHDPHNYVQVDEDGPTSKCLLEGRRFLWGIYGVMISQVSRGLMDYNFVAQKNNFIDNSFISR